MTLNYFKFLFFLLLFICNSCIIINLNNNTKRPVVNCADSYRCGIRISIPQNTKPLITNKVEVKCLSLTLDLTINETKLDWNSINCIDLPEGKYLMETHVIYLKKKIWMTSDTIEVMKGKSTNVSIKYPFLVSSKPKISILW